MLRIGDFSKIARVTVKTLRYYDKIGLLKPAFIDINTGYRYYTEEQLSKIYVILSYKQAGLSNKDIKLFLSEKYKGNELLQVCKDKLQKEIQTLQNQLSCIDRLLNQKEENLRNISIKDISACKVCYCCGYVNDIGQIPSFIKNCHLEMRAANLCFANPDYCCVIYPHDEYRENNIFIEYAQSVEETRNETEILKFKELEEVCVVSIVHYGNYDMLSNSYLLAVKWAQKNGYILRGDIRERYIHGAWDRDNESDWETEVQLPILKKEK